MTAFVLSVWILLPAAAAVGGPDALTALGAVARRKIHDAIGLTAEVSVVPPRTIERSVGKAKRALDLRR